MAKCWNTQRSDDGVLFVTLDVPDRSVNAFSQAVIKELGELITTIENDSSLRGVIFKSGKKGTFIVGADVEEMKDIQSAEQAKQFVERGQKVFERLSRVKTPTVALISGPCLGGGLEFALVCKYRITDDSRKTVLGLPEVRLGIVPGWGGTVRLPKQVGMIKALRMITTGQMLNGRQAKAMGLVDDFVPIEAMDQAGLRVLEAPPKPFKRRWLDRTLMETNFVKNYALNQASKMVLRQSHGHYPAPMRVIEVIRAGATGRPELGFVAEQEAIAELAKHPVTTECMRLFFLKEETKKWAEAVSPNFSDKKIKGTAVLGAGTMGAGLAYIMADKGMEVRLKDVTPEFLSKGLKVAADLITKDVKKKKVTKREAEQTRARISPTTDYSGFKHLDIVIEAVIEDINIKRQVFKDLENACGPQTILASNTSSLLVSEIAKAVKNPERVVGVHFFNPPNQMPLVEIVRTEQTGPEALTVALALVHKLGKTPIVVKECPGFLVNRLLSPYMNEAGYLLAEVDDPFELERAAVEFGFPMGPLKLTDLVGAGVAAKVAKVLHDGFGDRMKPAPVWEQLQQIQKNADPKAPKTLLIRGKKKGEKLLNPEVAELLKKLRAQNAGGEKLSRTEIAERMVFPIINEAARCLDEGIVENAEQVDLAMVFGTGFAPFRGGPLRYADKIGVEYIVETLDRWSEKHPRMKPCQALRDRAKKKVPFGSMLALAGR